MEKKLSGHFLFVLAACVVFFVVDVRAVMPHQKTLTIGDENGAGSAPYFYGVFDAAGFSDWIWYGPSPSHLHAYHELLCGEWGAAIYYDGIDTAPINPGQPEDRQAMWLTSLFLCPNWPTHSTFTAPGVCAAGNNPANPTPGKNMGQSVITNGVVHITIDYEVVDLEPLGMGYSPMSYLIDPDANMFGYAYSDRYIILQTYTIKNTDPNEQPLTNLEFYQFLHSHGADEFGPHVNSTYSDMYLADPLDYYTPYNTVHQVGNFRYDITQWNGPQMTNNVNHVDFVGFSSAVEPDWIDSDIFRGHYDEKPTEGTHINIENRALNGVDHIYNEEVGGAMGWSLGTLGYNQTASMTVAFMFGPLVENEDIILIKADDNDPNACLMPGNELTYTLNIRNEGLTAAENAVLVDYLPPGVTYPITYAFDPNTFELTSSDPAYDPHHHTYTWDLGTLPVDANDVVSLTVMVNENAEPGGWLRNRAMLNTSLGQVTAELETPICYWDTSGIIYVDEHATGLNIGTSWKNAYTDLQSALARARVAGEVEIWVAQGVYNPGRSPSETFSLPDGVGVYGGFNGTETLRNQRSPQRYPTILAGDLDAQRNTTVVTMDDATLLDGFTITGASSSGYGIYGNGSNFAVENCNVIDNGYYGIYAVSGNVTVKWSHIRNNGYHGIFHQGYSHTLTVENCWIRQNMWYGIYCIYSTPTVKNSIISESDVSETGNAGIFMFYPISSPILYNNTFAYNRNVGIALMGGNPPDVQNCILWYNNNDEVQFDGFDKQYIYHSSVYDPNDPHGMDYTLDVNNNFSGNPQLAYLSLDNVRIDYSSLCKDAGNPLMSYAGQVDMDGRDRVLGASVDIGAYEIDCDDVAHEFDWDADGVINLNEFLMFSRAWLTHDPNDPAIVDPNMNDPMFSNWNPVCNLDATGDSEYTIDLSDLVVFIEQATWLWTACWRTDIVGEPAMMAAGFGEKAMTAAVETPTIQVKSTQQEIFKLADTLETLRTLWLEEPEIQQEIDANDWRRFMEAVYENLDELQTRPVEIE